MKFKSYTVNPKGCENLANALIEHGKKIGYSVSRGLMFGTKHVLWFGGRSGRNMHGYCKKKSPNGTEGKKVSPRQFFKLTKEDVRIEPELREFTFCEVGGVPKPFKLTREEYLKAAEFIEELIKGHAK